MSVYLNQCALVNDDVLGFGTVKWHGISVEVFGNTKTYLGENTQQFKGIFIACLNLMIF